MYFVEWAVELLLSLGPSKLPRGLMRYMTLRENMSVAELKACACRDTILYFLCEISHFLFDVVLMMHIYESTSMIRRFSAILNV